MIALSVKRKADRQQMAEQVIATARSTGATAEIDDVMSRDRRIWVAINIPGGLDLTFCVDAESGNQINDVWVLSWHMGHGQERRINPAAFPFDAVNPFHKRKATSVLYSFGQALREVERVAKLAAKGELYEGTRS